MFKDESFSTEIDDDSAFVGSIVEKYGKTPRALIPLLQAVQNRYRYMPENILRRICEVTQISPAQVAGVSTFYSQFRHRPAGRHTIKVCIGTACHIKGANHVFDAFKKYLQIPDDEDTDRDREFTVEKVACLGCCMLAPAIQIDDIKYGFLDSKKVPRVLTDFLELEKQGAEADYSWSRRKPSFHFTGEIRLDRGVHGDFI
jgi:NADH:ubiquinone oxidoreductase subunit E